MTCLHCQAETSNGLALCEQCRMAVSIYLEFLPVYFRNLARWKPGQAGSRPVPGSRIPKGVLPPGRDPVEGALDDASGAVTTWARCLSDDRGVEIPSADTEAETVALVCRLLAQHLTSIATLEWAGEFVHEMQQHENILRRLTERIAPGWYAGQCDRCGLATHVVPGLTWVTCAGCGTTTYARDHLDTILNEAREWVARPMELAKALVALVDTELSVPRLHKRISKWGERGQVEVSRRLDGEGDPVGPKRYQLGEVLDRLHSEGATRLDNVRAEAS